MVGVKGQIHPRGVARRRAIIDAAIDHFGREGYRGTGLARVAEAAGVTTGGLLHHFGSKERLLVEVLERRDAEAREAHADRPTGSLAEVFAAWVDVATWNEERAPLTALYTILLAESIDPEHPAHSYFQQRTRRVVGRIERALVRAIEHGEIRAGVDAAAKAAEIVSFMEGAAVLWLPERVPGALRASFERFFADQLRVMTPT